jgi:hypothetical protein
MHTARTGRISADGVDERRPGSRERTVSCRLEARAMFDKILVAVIHLADRPVLIVR